MSNIYNIVKAQNNTLYNSVRNMHEIYSRDQNIQSYKGTDYDYIRGITRILMYIYAGVFLIFVGFLYFTTKFPWYVKILLAVIFAGFPFVAYLLENSGYQAIAAAAYYA